MFTLPKRNTQNTEQYAKEMERKREAFINQAPLKEAQPAESASVPTVTTSKPEFQDFKIKRTPSTEKAQRTKRDPKKTFKNKVDTYITDDMLSQFNALCQKESRTQAAMLRIILSQYLESSKLI